jgi:hypothetical protein
MQNPSKLVLTAPITLSMENSALYYLRAKMQQIIEKQYA